MNLQELKELSLAFRNIDFDEFHQVTKKHLNIRTSDSQRYFQSFLDHPLEYCCSRNPAAYGESLLDLAYSKVPGIHQEITDLLSAS